MEVIATASERRELGRTILFWMDGKTAHVAPVVLIPLIEDPLVNKQYFKVRLDYPAYIRQASLFCFLIALVILGFYLVRVLKVDNTFSPYPVMLIWLIYSIYDYVLKLARVLSARQTIEQFNAEGLAVLVSPRQGVRNSPDFTLLPDSLSVYAVEDKTILLDEKEPFRKRLVTSSQINVEAIRRHSFMLEAVVAMAGTAAFYLLAFMNNDNLLPRFGPFWIFLIAIGFAAWAVRLYTDRREKDLKRLAGLLYTKRGKWKMSSD